MRQSVKRSLGVVGVAALTVAVALAAIGAGTGVVTAATIYSGDFEDGTTGRFGAKSKVAELSINGQYSVLVDPSEGSSAMSTTEGSDTYVTGSGYILSGVMTTRDASQDDSGGGSVRFDSAPSNLNVKIQYRGDFVRLSRYDGTQNIRGGRVNVTPESWVKFKLKSNSSGIHAKAWEIGESEPSNYQMSIGNHDYNGERHYLAVRSDIGAEFYLDEYTLGKDTTSLRANVSGSVTANGSAVENATVTAFNDGTRVETTETGPDGGYGFEDLKKTSHAIEAAKPEDDLGANLTGPIYPPAENVNITLSEKGDKNIQGRVVSDLAEPLADVRVVTVDGDGVLQDKAYSADDGTFTVNGSGYTQVEFRLPGYETKKIDYGTIDGGQSVDLGDVTLYKSNAGVPDGESIEADGPNLVGPNGSETSIDDIRNETGDENCDLTIGQQIQKSAVFYLSRGLALPDYCSDKESTTRIDLLQSAAAMNESTQQYQTTLGNFLKETRGTAYTKGKIAALEALNNGASKSEARAAARQEINSYYSTLEYNVMQRWQAEAAQVGYHSQVENNQIDDPGNSSDVKWIGPVQSGSPTSFGSDYGADDPKTEILISLPDGTEQSVESVRIGSNQVLTPWSENTTSGSYTPTENGFVRAKGPEGRRTTLLPTSTYAKRLDQIEGQRIQVVDNTDRLVNSIYANYSAGEINITDVVDPVELATEGAIGQNSTNYFGFTSAQLAGIGAAGDPASAQQITMNGTVYEGTLFYAGTGDGPGTLETGRTYDPGNYNGSFLLAADEGIIPLEERFKINQQKNTKTGEDVDSVDIVDPTPERANSSDFVNNSENLNDARERADQTNVGGSPFGGDGGLFDLLDDLPGLSSLASLLGVSLGVAAAVAVGGLFIGYQLLYAT